MKKLFTKETPLVEPHVDAPPKKEKFIKIARKVEKFVDNHPFVSAAVVVGTTHVIAYGILAAVTNSEESSDIQDADLADTETE